MLNEKERKGEEREERVNTLNPRCTERERETGRETGRETRRVGERQRGRVGERERALDFLWSGLGSRLFFNL